MSRDERIQELVNRIMQYADEEVECPPDGSPTKEWERYYDARSDRYEALAVLGIELACMLA